MKQVTVSKEKLSSILKNCKFSDTLYVGLKEKQLMVRNIDLKAGIGMLDQTLCLDQPITFATPFYFAMNGALLSKVLKNLKGTAVELYLDDKNQMLSAKSKETTQLEESFGDRIDCTSAGLATRIQKKLTDSKDLQLTLTLPLSVLTEIISAAQALDTTVAFSFQGNKLNVRSARTDGKNFTMDYTIATIDKALSRRVYFGRNTRAILTTTPPQVEFCQLKFYRSFLVIVVKDENYAKQLYLTLRE